MKKILTYIRTYFLEDLKPGYLLFIVLFLSASIFVEYHWNIERIFFIKYREKPAMGVFYFLFYGLPFVTAYLAYAIFYKRYDVVKNYKFWVLSFVALAIYGFRCYSHHLEFWTRDYFIGRNDLYYYLFLSRQINQALLLFIPTIVLWFFLHRKEQSLYGFSLKGVDIRPYLWMLLIMLPIIGYVSTFQSFQDFYPLVDNIPGIKYVTWFDKVKVVVYELFYAFDFLSNEFFFRGFLILAFVRFAGKGAIMPMVCWYVFIHFGKPLGETISSFFGGLILGILAFETRSIAGGVIVHIGIALMMDMFGFLSKIFEKG